MNNKNIDKVIRILKRDCSRFRLPSVTEIGRKNPPFIVLISTLLSLRTKDDVTIAASKRLFDKARTPKDLLKLRTEKVEKLIYPVGFYKVKAKRIKEICRIILKEYRGNVPDNIDTILTLPGVGRKTANLVMTQGFGKLGICVDVHVHRISNRLGYVCTKTPDETEFALRQKLPKKYWIVYNDLLVAYGQNLCKPISPFCSKCKIKSFCKQVGVKTKR